MKRCCPLWLALSWLSTATTVTTAFVPAGQQQPLNARAPNNVSRRRMTNLCRSTTDSLQQQQQQQQALFYSTRDESYRSNSSDDDNSSSFDEIENAILRNRLQNLHVQALEKLQSRPPNPALSPTEFVSEFLSCLWENSDPLPDSGFRLLLAASTKAWRTKLYQSVGAPMTADEEVVATALGEAMGRPHNQFGILVQDDDAGEDEEDAAAGYVASFPSDPLEYADDGTAWVECQLRSKEDDKLLAITGWQLRKENDGDNACWLVDAIDWQDFRDEFRPGIGREEWVRICG